jgi:alpha-aminoadipic semialdehyde synthase
MFFSHTIKAQPENMALLDALMAKRIRFIDYECITSSGVRTGKR